jgi:DNA-binding transcriptional MerR regulator
MLNVLTTKQVADRLGITVRQAHHLIDRGSLVPVSRLDPPTGTYFFAESEVDRFAATRAEAQS